MPDGQHLAAEATWPQLASGPNGANGPRRASRADERDVRFQPVSCDRCAAAVLVAKFSLPHTSVQWSQASVRACAEFSARAATGEQTALIASCASLRDSIDRAVMEGRLEVAPP
jgi:hypothetical protein